MNSPINGDKEWKEQVENILAGNQLLSMIAGQVIKT